MIHTFKKGKERFVCDCGSGRVSAVSALQYKMLSYLNPPLSEELPTSLRYDLAKYDSGMVEEAYSELYALYLDGGLFSGGDGNIACGGCAYGDVCDMGKK